MKAKQQHEQNGQNQLVGKNLLLPLLLLEVSLVPRINTLKHVNTCGGMLLDGLLVAFALQHFGRVPHALLWILSS